MRKIVKRERKKNDGVLPVILYVCTAYIQGEDSGLHVLPEMGLHAMVSCNLL